MYDGDLKLLTGRLDKIEARLEELAGVFSAIANDIHSTHAAVTSYSAIMTEVQQFAGVVNNVIATERLNERTTAQSMGKSTAAVVTDWSTAVSTPVHSRHVNATVDGATAAAASGGGSDDEENPFELYESRRSRRNKRRREASGQQSGDTVVAAARVPEVRRHQPRRAPLVVGKLTAAHSSSATFTAAKPFVKKAVFCVDNIDISCTTTDIENFVAGLSVKVFSCFETTSRRRRSDTDETLKQRKAFRLCIDDNDRTRLLDDKLWPANVSVFEWYRKRPATRPGTQSASNTVMTKNLSKEIDELNQLSDYLLSKSAATRDPLDGDSVQQQVDMETTVLLSDVDTACVN
jgi:hypothetical protein